MELLTPEEARVLGCLLEKETTTPDTYPLSLNSLLLACNQKSNRDPIVEFDERTVIKALDALREKGLASQLSQGGARTLKYAHNCARSLPLADDEKAVLCVLLLRGPQTAGELKSRTERLFTFNSIEEADAVIARLTEREEPLLMRLPRLPGKRESRAVHLLCGQPDINELAAEAPRPADEPARLALKQENERLDALEAEVVSLRENLAELKEIVSKLQELL